MIENTNDKVTQQVTNKEGPVIVGYSQWCVIDIVDGVDPHESSIVSQVNRDSCDRVIETSVFISCEQGDPIFGVERGCE